MKRSPVAKFSDKIRRVTGGNFFIEIIYSSGVQSRKIKVEEVCVAFPFVQMLVKTESENCYFKFDYKNQEDMRDESGQVFGRGSTPDKAFADLLQFMAGKELILETKKRNYLIKVPRNLVFPAA